MQLLPLWLMPLLFDALEDSSTDNGLESVLCKQLLVSLMSLLFGVSEDVSVNSVLVSVVCTELLFGLMAFVFGVLGEESSMNSVLESDLCRQLLVSLIGALRDSSGLGGPFDIETRLQSVRSCDSFKLKTE